MRLLVTEPENYSDKALEQLSKKFVLTLGVEDKHDLYEKIVDVDVLLVRLGFKIDASAIDRAKSLKIIASPTTGLNHIDLDAAQASGIKIISLKGEYRFLSQITPTAELTMGLMLSLYRSIPAAFDHVKNGGWDRNLFVGREMKGKVLGVIGLGRLGLMVTVYAQAFGMRVVFYDTDTTKTVPGAERVEIDDLLRLSDIISIHIPYNKNNKCFIDTRRLDLVKPDACVINTSRGEVIDEKALLNKLESNELFCAGLDVLSNEPNADEYFNRNELIEFSKTSGRLIITPHIGGACSDSMRLTEEYIANKITNEEI